MGDVEQQVNNQAKSKGIDPPKIDLVFKPNTDDDRRFNVPTANEVSAVIVLNADGSISDNFVVVHPIVTKS